MGALLERCTANVAPAVPLDCQAPVTCHGLYCNAFADFILFYRFACLQALRTVALGALLERCAAGATLGASPLDYECDWSGVLSLGEQQRLAFARLLLARPPLALLDEATSALDGANERRLYEVGADGLQQLCAVLALCKCLCGWAVYAVCM